MKALILKISSKGSDRFGLFAADGLQVVSYGLQYGGVLRESGFFFHRQAGGLPFLPTAGQRAGARPSGSLQLLRRTGASGFIGSSAKNHDPALARHIEFGEAPHDLVGRYPQDSLSLQRARVKARIGPHIDDQNRISRRL
jgi:hypothetical protein